MVGIDKIASIITIAFTIKLTGAHLDLLELASGSSSSAENIARRFDNPEWSYHGLPIEGANDNHVNTKPKYALSSIATTTSKSANPPLDTRYRRIYNPDEMASIKEYPFLAALLVNGELWCAGSIIARDKILTAAHCLQLQYNNRFFREYVKMLTVRVGSTNATSGGDQYRVSEILFHPNYKPETLEFNFAVMRVHKNISFSMSSEAPTHGIAFSREPALPSDKDIVFLGWGSVLALGGKGGKVLLQKVSLPVYDIADCQEVYGKSLVNRNNFCAGYITLAKNVCNHDAGGPAVLDGVLVGILSFSSKRCDLPDRPAVFSNVGVVSDWLERIIEGKLSKSRTSALKPDHSWQAPIKQE